MIHVLIHQIIHVQKASLTTRIWEGKILLHQKSAVLFELCIIGVVQRTREERDLQIDTLISQYFCHLIS